MVYLDQAVDKGIIAKCSAQYVYEGNKIGQGREKAKQYLRDNPKECKEITIRLKKACGII